MHFNHIPPPLQFPPIDNFFVSPCVAQAGELAASTVGLDFLFSCVSQNVEDFLIDDEKGYKLLFRVGSRLKYMKIIQIQICRISNKFSIRKCTCFRKSSSWREYLICFFKEWLKYLSKNKIWWDLSYPFFNLYTYCCLFKPLLRIKFQRTFRTFDSNYERTREGACFCRILLEVTILEPFSGRTS